MAPDEDLCALDQPAVGFGENHAFWFFDADDRVHGYHHINAFQNFYDLRAERSWLTFPDGRVLYDAAEGAGTTRRRAAGANLAFTCIEPFRRWSVEYAATMRVSFAHQLAEGRPFEGPRCLAQIHLDFETAAEPWVYGALGAGAEAPESRFIGGRRYEQLCRVTGRVRTDDGDDVRVVGAGMRTHRRGPREMQGWSGHC
jgi:hypothetical protein